MTLLGRLTRPSRRRLDGEEGDEDTKKSIDDYTKVEEVTEEEEAKNKCPKMNTFKMTENKWQLLSKNKPILTRNPKDCEKDDYASSYKEMTIDWKEQFAEAIQPGGLVGVQVHFSVPKRSPFDMMKPKKKRNSISLYVKRVFITENCDDLMPEYLNFVKGVVDSKD